MKNSMIQMRICLGDEVFDDNLSAELQKVLNAPDLINKLIETEYNEHIPLIASNGARVGTAWVQEATTRQIERALS